MYYGLLGLASKKAAGYGTLTTAWIAATGETDLTILGALNTLESDLTTYGLTSKLTALYPFVGGTSTKHSYNFMNTSAYQLTFNGGWTHNSNGVTGNGTNGYANTGLNYTTLNSGHQSLYSRSAVTESGAVYDMGAFNGGNTWQLLSLYSNANLLIGGFNSDSYPRNAMTNSSGMFVNNRTGSSAANLWRNGSKLTQSTQASSAIPNINNYIGALNNAGNAQGYSAKNYALASIGDGLTDTQAANFYTAVQAFQTTLGRQVGVPIVSDSDAQAFLNAAVITDTTQATAINNFVIGLKADNLWTKMAAIYPFVGGNATAHSYNLKNTAAYQLTFLGGWTHSSTGALANGTNGMADTGILPPSLNNFGFGFYGYKSTYEAKCQMGAESGAGVTFLYGCFNSSASMLSNINGTGQKTTSGTYANVKGFYSVSRTDASTVLTRAVNDTASFSVSGGTLQTAKTMYIGANNYASTGDAHCNTEFRGAFLGEGLTATESGNLKTAFDTFNATLSRTA